MMKNQQPGSGLSGLFDIPDTETEFRSGGIDALKYIAPVSPTDDSEIPSREDVSFNETKVKRNSLC